MGDKQEDYWKQNIVALYDLLNQILIVQYTGCFQFFSIDVINILKIKTFHIYKYFLTLSYCK